MKKDKVSVIVPTLNEEGCIKSVLNEIPKGFVDEILIVDGNSTDNTVKIVRQMGYPVVMQEGGGLGNGIKTAIKHVTGDIIIVLDADGSHNPKEIPRMLKKMEEGYDVVVASRYINGGGSLDDTIIRYFGNRFFNFLCALLHGLPIHDILMGFKVFRKKVLEDVEIKTSGQEYDAEIVIKAHKKGFRLGEVPVIERKRMYGETKLRDMHHGYKILKVIIKEFFSR